MDGVRKTTQEAIFSALFKDIDDQVRRLEELRTEIPQSLQSSVDEIIGKTNVQFTHLNQALQGIIPEIERSVSEQGEKADIHVGRIVQAAEKLNASANELVSKKVSGLSGTIDKAVNDAVTAAIDRSLSIAIGGCVRDLKHELENIEKKAQNIAEEAEKAAQGSLYTRLGTMFAAGLVGAVLTTTLLIAGINNDWISIKPVWDARHVASELYNLLMGKK